MNKFLSTEFNTKVLYDKNKVELINENNDIISLMINFTSAILISLFNIMKNKTDDLN